jgi:hypothetical protein
MRSTMSDPAPVSSCEDVALIERRPVATADMPAPPVDSAEPVEAPSFAARALAHWPRLDRVRLNRARDDPRRIARLIMRRTALPVEAIVAILVRDPEDTASRALDLEEPAAEPVGAADSAAH